MKKFLTQGRLAALIVFAVLLIDQVIKIWIIFTNSDAPHT